MSDVFFDRVFGMQDRIPAADNVRTGMRFLAPARRSRDPKVSLQVGQTIVPRKQRGWDGRGQYKVAEQKYATPDHELDQLDLERRREQWIADALKYYQS